MNIYATIKSEVVLEQILGAEYETLQKLSNDEGVTMSTILRELVRRRDSVLTQEEAEKEMLGGCEIPPHNYNILREEWVKDADE